MKQTHSPLPWREEYGQVESAKGAVVAKRESSADIKPTERDANMHYIVTACNAYPELVALLNKCCVLAYDEKFADLLPFGLAEELRAYNEETK